MSIKEELILKAEKRQKIKNKKLFAPKGASLAGQFKRAQTSMFYAKRKNVTRTGNKARMRGK